MEKQTLGMTIASLRKARGMTQSDLAEKMGVTDKAVSKWERDLCCPDINSFPKLADVFGTSVDELMQFKPAGQEEKGAERPKDIPSLVFKAVTLAMGVAVVVLSVMNALDLHSGLTMLGIGMACAGIALIRDH